MTDDIEQRLGAALNARTSHITAAPAGLVRLRHELVTPRRTGSPRIKLLAAAAGVVVVAGIATSLAPRGAVPPDVANGTLGSAPFAAAEHFVAVLEGDNAIVRASDGKVVAAVPEADGRALRHPVLSPDGLRAYGSWSTRDGREIGYVDLRSGKSTTLDRSPETTAVSLSADGRTLAYDVITSRSTLVAGGVETVWALVVLDLATGRKTSLEAAPVGAQGLQFALSPSGDQLAVVPTDVGGPTRPLQLVSSADPAAFSRPTTVGETLCGSGAGRATFDQPRWTTRSLYAYYRCGSSSTDSEYVSGVATVDLELLAARPLMRLPSASIYLYTALDTAGQNTLVTSDESRPGLPLVTIYDAAAEAEGRRVEGVTGLAVPAAQ
jgi:hypothetical protein